MSENPFVFDEEGKEPVDQTLHKLSQRLLNQVGTRDRSKQAPLNAWMPREFKPFGTRRTYAQDWPAYNAVKQREKLLLYSLLGELLDYTSFPARKGREISLRQKLFYVLVQSYDVKSSRRCVADLEIARRMNLIDNTPHFNTVLKALKDPRITIYLKHLVNVSGLPLQEVERDFAIDSSGFSLGQYGRWFDVRLGERSDKKKYAKLHICVGTKTNIISAVDVTEGTAGDAPYLPGLVRETAKVFNIETLSADKAYSSSSNLSAVVEAGGTPYIPFKKNARPSSRSPRIWRQVYKKYRSNPEEFKAKYHLRSNSETNFFMLKTKFAKSLRSKTPISQANELLAMCLAHNLCVLAQEAVELDLKIDFSTCAEQTLYVKPQ